MTKCSIKGNNTFSQSYIIQNKKTTTEAIRLHSAVSYHETTSQTRIKTRFA